MCIKPYPVCHYIHGCADAAVELHSQLSGRLDEIDQVIAWLPEATLPIVAEPAEVKRHARTDYEAKFSAVRRGEDPAAWPTRPARTDQRGSAAPKLMSRRKDISFVSRRTQNL
jgi:hypothetical protein